MKAVLLFALLSIYALAQDVGQQFPQQQAGMQGQQPGQQLGQPQQAGLQGQQPTQDSQGQQSFQSQFPQQAGQQQGGQQPTQQNQFPQQGQQQGQSPQQSQHFLLPEGITASNVVWQGFATLGNSLNLPLSGNLVFSRVSRQQVGQQGLQGQGQQAGQQGLQGQGQQVGQQGLQEQQRQQKRQAELQGQQPQPGQQQVGQQPGQQPGQQQVGQQPGQQLGQQLGQQAGQQQPQPGQQAGQQQVGQQPGQQAGQQLGQQQGQQQVGQQGIDQNIDSILYLRVQASLPAPFVVDTWLLTNQQSIDIYINRDNNCTLLRIPVQDIRCDNWKPINTQQTQSQPMTSQIAQGSQQQQGMSFFQKDCAFGQQSFSFVVGSDQSNQLVSLQVMSNVNNQMSPLVTLSVIRQQGAPQASDLQLPGQCIQPSNTFSGLSSIDLMQRYMSTLLGQ